MGALRPVRVAVLAAAALPLAASGASPETRRCDGRTGIVGDATGDGTADVLDAQRIARFAAGLPVPDPARVEALGDVDGDGSADVVDAQLVARHAADLGVDAPVGESCQAGDRLRAAFPGPSADHQPPDLSIAAGSNGLIVATNGGISLYSKSGETLAGAGLHQFFGHFPDAAPADPRAVYDPVSERFFITAMDHGVGGPFSTDSPGRFFVAVSTGSDPSSVGSADWHRYAFETPSDPDDPELFPDFSRIGVTRTAVVVVGQMIPIGRDARQDFQCFTRLLIVEKDPVLSGRTPDTAAMDQLQAGKTCASLKPVKVSTESPNLLLINEEFGCELGVWALRDPLADPTISTVTLTGTADVGTAFCDALPHAEQPDTDWKLDTGRRSPPMAEPVLRAGDLWTARVIGVKTEAGDRTGVQWLRISVSGWPGSAQVVESEIFHKEGYAYYPTISANESGDFAVAYGRSSNTEHPSTFFRFLDPSSETPSSSPRLLKAGDASLTSGNSKPGRIRYGDYFGAAWDPADGTIWILGEYVKASDTWGSWIGNVAF